MTTDGLVRLLSAVCLTPAVPLDRTIQRAMACDLLSHAMAHAGRDMAWITVRSQMTAVAIAAMYGVACIILPDEAPMAPEVASRAESEGIAVLQTSLSAYAVCARLSQAGVDG